MVSMIILITWMILITLGILWCIGKIQMLEDYCIYLKKEIRELERKNEDV